MVQVFLMARAQAAPVDQTERNVTLVIIALLVVALLLALLTIWFWRHTDPRRRRSRRMAARGSAARTPAPQPGPAAAAPAQQLVDEGLSADEWAALTGPQPKRAPVEPNHRMQPDPRRQPSG